MDYQRINATTERWSDSQGTLTFSVPYPGVVRQTVEGRASVELGQKVIEKLEQALEQHRPLRVFDDWEKATGYDSEVRVRLTEWTRRNQHDIPETHILVGSKIVSMGLAVAAMVLKKRIEVYSDRWKFERVYSMTAGAVRGAAQRP